MVFVTNKNNVIWSVKKIYNMLNNWFSINNY